MAQNALSTSSPAHMELARFWLNECLEKHIDCRLNDSKFVPTRLIDVGTEDRRLPIRLSVNGNPGQRTHYCALSHCWGHASERMNLTTTNIGLLQERIPPYALPTSFQDAFGINAELNLPVTDVYASTRIEALVQEATKANTNPGFLRVHSLWFGLVKEYASGQLTKEQDKLVALSGVAQRIQ